MNPFGSYLKSLREAKNFTLREVESKTGISNAYLSQLEKDKVKQPSPINLYKLSKAYGVSYELLMEKVGYPVPKNSQNNELEVDSSSKVVSRFGGITEEEEEELLDYLKFIRTKKNKRR